MWRKKIIVNFSQNGAEVFNWLERNAYPYIIIFVIYQHNLYIIYIIEFNNRQKTKHIGTYCTNIRQKEALRHSKRI